MDLVKKSNRSNHWLYEFLVLGIACLVLLLCLSTTATAYAQTSKPANKAYDVNKLPERSGGSYINEVQTETVVSSVDAQPVGSPLPNIPPPVFIIDAMDFDDNATQNAGSVFVPANPSGAIGTTHFVAAVNSMIAWYAKGTGTEQSIDALKDFFTSLSPQTFPFNPKVIYDQFEDRFIVIALEKIDEGSLNPGNVSTIFVAVSATSDPGGTWYFHKIDAKKTFTNPTTATTLDHWADSPGLAVDEEAVYITADMFPFGDGPFGGSRLWIIDKGVSSSGFYQGGAVAVTFHDPYAPFLLDGAVALTTQPAHVFGADGVGGPDTTMGTFLVSYSGLSGTVIVNVECLQLIRVDNPVANPTFTDWKLIPVGDIDDTDTAVLPDAPQKGSTIKIDTGDRRVQNAVWRDDYLWLTANILPHDDPPYQQVTAHWWRYATNTIPPPPTTITAPAVAVGVEQGNVYGENIAPGTFTFFPSIAVNDDGDMKIGFSASAPSIFAGAYFTGKQSSDEGLHPSVVLRAGQDTYVRPLNGENRWGDYSSMSVDPADDTSFWMFNQFALEGEEDGIPGNDGLWGTVFSTCDFTPVPDVAQMDVTPVNIDFGVVRPFDSAEAWISIINNGTEDLVIDSISSPGSPFDYMFPVTPFTLQTFEFEMFPVAYIPEELGADTSGITIGSSTAGIADVEVMLIGESDLSPALLNTCYASTGGNDGGRLLSINTTTGGGTLIGNIEYPSLLFNGTATAIKTVKTISLINGGINIPKVPALAINSKGQIFGTSNGNYYMAPAELFRIDAETAEAFPLTSFDSEGPPPAIAFDENDILYAVDFAYNLFTIDIVTGDTTRIGNVGVNIAGLAFDPTTGILWASTGAEGESSPSGSLIQGPDVPLNLTDAILTIDKTTADPDTVGFTGLGGQIPDIAFNNAGDLFGLKGGGASPDNTFISINKSNGAGTGIGQIGFTSVSGLAFSNAFDVVCNPTLCDSSAVFPTAASGELGDPIKGVNGELVYIDIQIKENPNTINAFGMTVTVDPSQLEFVEALKGDLTAAFVSVDGVENTPGNIICGGFGGGSIPPNSTGSVIRLCFLVTCAETEESDITISALTDGVAGFSACCNKFQCTNCFSDGDVNNDLALTPGDALCAFEIFLNGQSAPPECDFENFPCEVIAANVNCDAQVTPGDALAIFQRYLSAGLPEECFAQPAASLAKTGPAYNLSLLRTTDLATEKTANELVKVALTIDNPKGLEAFGLSVNYPTDKFEFIGMQRSETTADWEKLAGQVNESGKVTIGGFSLEAIETSATSELFELVFRAKGEVNSSDAFVIDELMDDFGTALVQNSASDEAALPDVFALHQNYPNPFNPETQIRFDLPKSIEKGVKAHLAIYNMTGQLVRVLLDEERSAGSYEIRWDGRNASGIQVPSGMYIYSISAGNFKDSKKMLLLK